MSTRSGVFQPHLNDEQFVIVLDPEQVVTGDAPLVEGGMLVTVVPVTVEFPNPELVDANRRIAGGG